MSGRASLRARAGTTGVRMGPISLFALVVALCLAVMAVLAVTTARASSALAERQAAFTADDYANEAVAAEVLARVREAAGAAEPSGAPGAVGRRLEALLAEASAGDEEGPVASAEMDGDEVVLHVESASGRCLDATLAVGDDGEVRVTSWKATTRWEENTGDVLWTGQE